MKFADCFEDIPHTYKFSTDIYYHIKLKNPSQTFTTQTYLYPQKLKETWKTLIDQHLAAGCISLLSSSYFSSIFLVPKISLLHIETIFADVSCENNFGKINITNLFFQTQVYYNNIILIIVNTSFGMYKQIVIPMEKVNALAIHQQYMTLVLLPLIRKICHVYINDIIIQSSSIEKHMNNISRVLQALRKI